MGKLRLIGGALPAPVSGAYTLTECYFFAIRAGSRKAFREKYGAVYATASRNRWLPIINQSLGFDPVTPASVRKTFRKVRVTQDGKVYEFVVPYDLNL